MLRLVEVFNIKTKKLLNPVFLIIFLVFPVLFYSSVTFAGSKNVFVSDLEISPNYATEKTLFAKTKGAGIYKTVDGGQNWYQLSLGNGFNSQDTWIYNLLISPSYSIDNTLIADMINRATRKTAILYSSNGGITWAVSSKEKFDHLAISPNYSVDKSIFGIKENYKTGKSSLYRSNDNGVNWTIVAQDFTNSESKIFLSPNFATDNTIFAIAYYGIYRSMNGGISWTRLIKTSKSYNLPTTKSIAFSPVFETDKTIFADYNYGLIRSNDGGQSWRLFTSGIEGIPTWFSISPDYENDSTIFLVTEDLTFMNWKNNIFKSNDNGQSWSKIYSSPLITTNHISNIKISPDFKNDNSLFLSGLEGVQKSSDGGVNWVTINKGLSKLNPRLTISSNRKVIRKGMSIILTVRLKKQDGSVFPNRVIAINALEQVVDPYEEDIKNVRTNEKGAFRIKVSPKRTTTYFAGFYGDYKYDRKTSNIKIKVLR